MTKPNRLKDPIPMPVTKEGPASLSDENVMLFTGNSNPELAKKIAEYLGVELGNAVVTSFQNGETRIQIEENVRGSEVFVVQPTCGNVNNALMELLIMVDALSRSSAKSITAVVPYYGYARQEKKTMGREPISAKLVANLMTTAGCDRVITIDLHAAAIQGFFDIPVDNLMMMPIAVDYFRQKNIPKEELVIVSPDAGGVARARAFAERLGAGIAILFKRRPRPDAIEVMDMVGEIEGKTILVVDDIISTGGTLVRGVEMLKKLGAKKIYAAATHATLAGNAVQLIEDSPLEEVIVSDTVPINPDTPSTKITTLSVASLLGEAIRRNYFHQSVSKLFR